MEAPTSPTSPRSTSTLQQPHFTRSHLSSSTANLDAATEAAVASASAVHDGPFRSLIAQKERELHDINEYRLKSLEEAVRTREASEKAIRTKFKKLKDDFVFNLRLIEERDRELDKYEATCDKLKTYVREREKDIANMKIEMTEHRSKLSRSEEECARKEVDFQHQLKTQASQAEAYRWESEQQTQEHETRFQTLTVRLEETLRERTSALESQQHTLQAEARRIVETAESRHQAKDATYERKVRDLDTKIQSQQKLILETNEKIQKTLHESDELHEKITSSEAEVKKLQWELSDVKLTKDREIQTLIKDKNDLKTMKQSLLDEYETKMSELLQSLHAVEGAFVQQREQYELQLRQEASSREDDLRRMSQRLQEQLRSAQEQLTASDRARNELKRQMKDTQGRDHEALAVARREAETGKQQLASMQTRTNDVTREHQGKIWSLEMEAKDARERSEEARSECETIKADLRIVQMEVERSTTRESDMKREYAQQSAAWQTRWERERTDIQERHDQMVSVLQSQRDHMETEARALETRTTELETDRDRLRNELNEMKTTARAAENRAETLALDLQRAKATSAATAIRGVTAHTKNEPRGVHGSGFRELSAAAITAKNDRDGRRSVRSSVDSLDDFETSDDLGPMASPLRPLRAFDEEEDAVEELDGRREGGHISGGRGGNGDGNGNGFGGEESSTTARVLEAENQKLRAAVSIMAREMEDIQRRRQDDVPRNSGTAVMAASIPHHDVVPETPPRGVDHYGPPSPEMTSRLNEAETNVKLLMEERERLMEVSNGVGIEVEKRCDVIM